MNRVVAEVYSGASALTFSSTTVSLSPFTGAGFNNVTLVYMTFEGSACRYRLDGITAHSGTGHIISGNSTLTLHGSDAIKGFSMIATVPTAFIFASYGWQ